MNLSPRSCRALLALVCVLCAGVAAQAADVSGTIKMADKQPKLRTLQMGADPVCAAKHTEAVKSEAVLVNENGTLRNVFVYIKSGLKKAYEPPAEHAVLDQDGCMYHPHVLGVQVGQSIDILNSDGILHNIHPKPTANAEFNLAMPKFLKKKTQVFSKPEVMIPVKCDVHPWMQSYIGVVDNPFFAVTGEDGSFAFRGLPAGTYTVEAWHEICGTQTQEVTVKADGTATVEFTFQLPKRKQG